MKGIEEVLVYNGVGVIEATSRNYKKKIRYELEMNGFTTFSPKLIKRKHGEPLKTLVTTMEGVKFIALDLLSDRDVKAINKAEKFYFRSQRDFEEYLSALSEAVGLIIPMATRPTAMLLLSVAEHYGVRVRANIYEHKPVIHVKPLVSVDEKKIERALKDYKAMNRGGDTGSILTEFKHTRTGDGLRVVSRRLKDIKGDRVFFDDGGDQTLEWLKDMTDEEFASGVLKWTAMR